jgi:hypothetical protein
LSREKTQGGESSPSDDLTLLKVLVVVSILDLVQVCWHRSCKYFGGKNT